MLQHRPCMNALASQRPNNLLVEDSSWDRYARRGLRGHRRRLLQEGVVIDELTSKVHFVWAWLGAHYGHLMRAAYSAGADTGETTPPRSVLLGMVAAWKSAGF